MDSTSSMQTPRPVTNKVVSLIVVDTLLQICCESTHGLRLCKTKNGLPQLCPHVWDYELTI